jgi:hypothetical protein
MIKPWRDQKITEFVKGVLGCKCPVEVFNTIVISQLCNQHIPFSISRLNIGDTLSVYESPKGSGSLKPISFSRCGHRAFPMVYPGKQAKAVLCKCRFDREGVRAWGLTMSVTVDNAFPWMPLAFNAAS